MNPVRIYVLTAFTVPPPVPKSQQQILDCRYICLFETFLVVAQETKNAAHPSSRSERSSWSFAYSISVSAFKASLVIEWE